MKKIGSIFLVALVLCSTLFLPVLAYTDDIVGVDFPSSGDFEYQGSDSFSFLGYDAYYSTYDDGDYMFYVNLLPYCAGMISEAELADYLTGNGVDVDSITFDTVKLYGQDVPQVSGSIEYSDGSGSYYVSAISVDTDEDCYVFELLYDNESDYNRVIRVIEDATFMKWDDEAGDWVMPEENKSSGGGALKTILIVAGVLIVGGILIGLLSSRKKKATPAVSAPVPGYVPPTGTVNTTPTAPVAAAPAASAGDALAEAIRKEYNWLPAQVKTQYFPAGEGQVRSIVTDLCKLTGNTIGGNAADTLAPMLKMYQDLQDGLQKVGDGLLDKDTLINQLGSRYPQLISSLDVAKNLVEYRFNSAVEETPVAALDAPVEETSAEALTAELDATLDSLPPIVENVVELPELEEVKTTKAPEEVPELEVPAEEPAAVEETKPGVCPNCGEPVQPDASFCGNCGTKL